MRAPSRRRPPRRERFVPPGIDLATIAERMQYVGSPEHKSYPSAAGPPRLRSDATKCDEALGSFEELTEWLRESARAEQVGGPWEGNFPRYVWHVREDVCYEARLVNRGNGEYKGYPLTRAEEPRWLR